jgi:hypothetical protein
LAVAVELVAHSGDPAMMRILFVPSCQLSQMVLRIVSKLGKRRFTHCK